MRPTLLLCALLGARGVREAAALPHKPFLPAEYASAPVPPPPSAYAGLRCPATPLQDPDLASRFEVSPFLGPYFEVALHDYTQPKMCGCQTANKSMAPVGRSSEDVPVIDDDFVMVCPAPSVKPDGKSYPSALSFNLTDEPGVFAGTWPLTPRTVFQDTVVAVGWPDDPSFNSSLAQKYRWAVEFQCVEKFERVVFVGVNFYSRWSSAAEPEGQRADQEMRAAAAAFGVYDYTGGPEGITPINHTGCP